MASATREGRTCSICGKGKLRILTRGGKGVQYRCDTCGGLHADAFGRANTGVSASRLRARSGQRVKRLPPKIGSNPLKELDSRKTNESEVRYVTDRSGGTKAKLQVAWHPDGTLKHVDCKRCNNKWYLADGDDLEEYFESNGEVMRCKKCGLDVDISAV